MDWFRRRARDPASSSIRTGHILTNYHVIADARQIEVTLHNRKKYRATIVGTDR